MIFKIRHRLRFDYASPAVLGPQTLRVRPREDGSLRLLDHVLTLSPQPSLLSTSLDENNNVETRAWFLGAVKALDICAESTVETLRYNPFDFVIDADYSALPWGGRVGLERPALAPALLGPVEPEAALLATELSREAGGDALSFLLRLNRALNERIAYEVRPEGAAQEADETLRLGRGACRDLALLFCAAARSVGMPARFVSGYHEGDPDLRAKELHAWAEVFLPGAGWRGFDPSTGLACADKHVTLAAGLDPAGAAPVSGRFGAALAQSHLTATVEFV